MGNEVGRGSLFLGQIMCIDFGNVSSPISGIKTKDPSFNMPAVWVDAEYASDAVSAGYITVDCPTVISTHIEIM